MEQVSKRDLNQHTAEILRRVSESGDSVVVTERGRPRWRLAAFTEQESPLARLEREGHFTPASPMPTPWASHPGGPSYTDDQVDALLDELRGDH